MIGLLKSFCLLTAAFFQMSTRKALRFVKTWTIFPVGFLALTPHYPLWSQRVFGVENAIVAIWLMVVVVLALFSLLVIWTITPGVGSRPRFVAYAAGCALGVMSSLITLLVVYGALGVQSYVMFIQTPSQFFQATIVVALLVDQWQIWYGDKGFG